MSFLTCHEAHNDKPGQSGNAHLNNPAASSIDALVRCSNGGNNPQIRGLTDTMQLLVQQQQAMSQLVKSQLNIPRVLREGTDPPQSSAVRDGDNPAVQNGEQVAEFGTQAQSVQPGQLKPAIEEEHEALLGKTSSPFLEYIMQAQLPKGFAMLRLDMNKGKTDATEHLSHCWHAMALFSHSNAIMCRAFSNTLSDFALSLFKKLPPLSVPFFVNLGVKFINQFLTNKKVKKGLDHMLTIWQAKGEILRNYITCFNAELHNVEDCELQFATSALKVGLTTSLFLYSITKNKPKDHAELLARANKYILVKDLDQSLHELRSLLEPRP